LGYILGDFLQTPLDTLAGTSRKLLFQQIYNVAAYFSQRFGENLKGVGKSTPPPPPLPLLTEHWLGKTVVISPPQHSDFRNLYREMNSDSTLKSSSFPFQTLKHKMTFLVEN
jgi:hypothetical protein